jgi:hypothetical protein
MKRNRPVSVFLLALVAACSSGGGGGGPSGPDIPAAVPEGAGGVQIDMAGTWVIQNATVVETNATVPDPPVDGTMFQFEPTRIATIGGLSVDPDDLAAIIGAPLISYVNQIDASRVFYGLVVDRRPSGGTRLETALAGGAVDANTIAVEAFNSLQAPNDVEPMFTRSRYLLVRVPGTTPLQHRPEDWTADDLVRAAFGGR